jgi:NMD protein affecting ribosome stability and mRNA decay
MSERVNASIMCAHCARETEHALVYVGRILATTRCLTCGHEVRHEHGDLVPSYLRDLEHRLVTKPLRMARRARSDRSFMRSLPRAILRQPRKIWDDLRLIFRRTR